MSNTDKADELRYFPRNLGKSYQQWQTLIAASRRGESVVYRLPEGDICSPARVEQLIESEKQKMLFDLDEIDNKPWRVFRQLAELMPEYADTYLRYEAFYSYGGSADVMKLIEAFEKTDEFKQSGFPERIESKRSKS